MPPKPKRGESDAPSSHLWVGNLPFDVTEAELTALFEKHGVVDGVTCYASRSYAFVYYNRVEDAVAAKDALQGFVVNGSPLKIEFAKPAKPSKHVWIGGFGSSVTKDKLEEELSKFGIIEDFKFIRDRNTALVDFVRLEDASAAVKNMNGLQIGEDRIRVDFLRSHPSRREQSDFHEMGNAPFKGMGFDPSWINPDLMRTYPEPTYSGHKRPQPSQSFGGRRTGNPSKVLWVGFPPSIAIDEEMLHNAMILHGEIERIKCFPGRNYCFVEFRSVEEARRAMEASQGKLFNDPRISIMFSNSDLAPKDPGPPFPGYRGQRPDLFGNEGPFRPPLMDMFPSNGPMAPIGFPGLGPGMPRQFGPRGNLDPLLPTPDFHDTRLFPGMSDLNTNAPLGLNQRKLSPPAGGLLPSPAGSGRASYKTSGWDVLDPSQLPRESKRSRIDGHTSFHDPSVTTGTGDGYIASVDQAYGGGPQFVGGPLPGGHSSEDYIWRGLIAKGGTPVCNARCIPIGKGLECELPEVVNCSARTGLDMLAKHYAGAIGFDIVFFLPDSEEDFANYTEFLRYLGSKNRAGVAKLDDGTTLFLVPPSDFLTDVLKVTGRERLYGVVLKLPQNVSGGPSASQQMHQPLPPIQPLERQLARPTHEYVAPKQESAVQMEYSRTVPDEVVIPPKEAYPTTSVAQDKLIDGVPATSRPAATLTPELIATLQSMLPVAQSSVAQNATPPLSFSTSGPVSTNEKGGFPQGWHQQPQVLDQPGQSSQQFGNQLYSNVPFQSFPTNLNVNNHPVQALSENPAIQNPAYNYQEQGSLSSRHAIVHPVGAPGQQFVPPTQGTQQYPSEFPHSAQNSYGMHGTPAGSYGVPDNQQFNNPGFYANQFHGANQFRPEMNLPSSTASVKAESLNSGERQQTVPSVVGQGTTDVEVDKNQRYQSTLQFAANLLLQIQQQQQQQQAGSHMGNQQ